MAGCDLTQTDVSTHLAAEHEGDGAVGAGHFAVAQHGRETLHLLHIGPTALGRQPPPAGALAAPPAPPGSSSPCTSSDASSSSLSTSSSSAAAAAAPCSYHPPSFLASLHHGREETSPKALPSFKENHPFLLFTDPSSSLW